MGDLRKWNFWIISQDISPDNLYMKTTNMQYKIDSFITIFNKKDMRIWQNMEDLLEYIIMD